MGKGHKPQAFSSYDELLNLLDQRRQDLGISMAELDRRAGLSEGYSGHIFSPNSKQGRGLGTVSLPLIFGALGVKLAYDDAAAARYAPKHGSPLTKGQLLRRRKSSNDNAES